MNTPRGPWTATNEHPLSWARRTGRILHESEWVQQYAADPAGVAGILELLTPVVLSVVAPELERAYQRLVANGNASADNEGPDEYAHLFPPKATRDDGPDEYAHLHRPAQASADEDDEFAHLFRPKQTGR